MSEARDKYLVQYTDSEGGVWQNEQYFDIESAARAQMRHLVEGLGKTSARVLHELAYQPRSTAN